MTSVERASLSRPAGRLEAVSSYGGFLRPGRRLVLAGFLFGAYVALNVAQRRDASWLITVAPPMNLLEDFFHGRLSDIRSAVVDFVRGG